MISREEKNKKYVDEIKKERTIKISKIILKILGILILIFSIIFLYMYFIGPKGLKTNEYVIKNNLISTDFHGIKILHFSDLLYGSTINKKSIEKIEKEIKLINPDIVFFTGNIVFDKYDISEDEIKYLNNFFENIPYKFGKYAILGDLDSSNAHLILENTHFTILDNEIVSIYNKKSKINIIGLSDKENKELELENNDYTITLINNYDNYEKYSINSNLVLAGHNLGGEIKLFNLPIICNDKYMNSFYQKDDTKVYISSGLGTRSHMRLMNKPSLNVYRLYSK